MRMVSFRGHPELYIYSRDRKLLVAGI